MSLMAGMEMNGGVTRDACKNLSISRLRGLAFQSTSFRDIWALVCRLVSSEDTDVECFGPLRSILRFVAFEVALGVVMQGDNLIGILCLSFRNLIDALGASMA